MMNDNMKNPSFDCYITEAPDLCNISSSFLIYVKEMSVIIKK